MILLNVIASIIGKDHMDKQLLRKDLVGRRENLPNKIACIEGLTRAMRVWLMSRSDHVIGAYWPIKGEFDPLPALHRYETVRRPITAKVVQTNRTTPPDFINIKVDELTGGQPFRHIDDVISQAELRKISDDYKKIAGFSLEALKPAA